MKLADNALLCRQAFINNRWIDAQNKKQFPIINPADNEQIIQIADLGETETLDAIESASAAFNHWKNQLPSERCRLLKNWAQLMKENLEDLALILTSEQGKPLREAKDEIDYAIAHTIWAAEEGMRIYGEILPISASNRRGFVLKQPIGVIGAITPWNFPVATVMNKIAPAIAAGCTVILKPSELTPLSALALAKLAEKANLPAGVFNILPSNQAEIIGKTLTNHPSVKLISFTGSTEVGKILMEQAAKTVTKVILEMGGNAPFIVFEDADLGQVMQNAISGKFSNAGQVCVSINRMLIHQSLHDEFVLRLNNALSNSCVGNGLDEKTTCGPLINDEAIKKIKMLIADAVEKGAQIIQGGKKHQLGGTYFEPTIIDGVTTNMRIANEEIFGPVAAIQTFKTEEEAISVANNTHYGLAGYFYTKDSSRIWRVAESLEYGVVSVNSNNFSSATAPFGGIKESGIGKQGGKYGMENYCELKYINISI